MDTVLSLNYHKSIKRKKIYLSKCIILKKKLFIIQPNKNNKLNNKYTGIDILLNIKCIGTFTKVNFKSIRNILANIVLVQK